MKEQYVVQTAAKTNIGGKKNNEDRFVLFDAKNRLVKKTKKGQLFAVADGMGGQRGGERASEIAINTLQEYYSALIKIENKDDVFSVFSRLFTKANEKIYSEGTTRQEYYGMGSTLTTLTLKENNYYFSHAGDSRLYLFKDGQLIQLSEDHTIAAQLAKMEQITPEEARTHSMRHQLLKFLGTEKKLIPQQGTGIFQPGNGFLLCSDGLTDVLTDKEIREIIKNNNSLEKICQQLVEGAVGNDRKGKDNITVLFIGIADLRKSWKDYFRK